MLCLAEQTLTALAVCFVTPAASDCAPLTFCALNTAWARSVAAPRPYFVLEVLFMSWIDISDLSFAYEGSVEPVFEHLNVRLDTDWRLGLIGRNGRGKTTLLRLLMGMEGHSGRISTSAEFDYFPFPVPDREQTGGEVAEALRPALERWRLRREMGPLGLDEEMLYRPFSTLSNGEQTRFLLALLFAEEGKFLLIDEPTNHLDLAGRELVGRYLSGKNGFLLVSHDRAFLDGSIDHVLAFNRSGLEVQKGNFSSWWENRERREQFERAEQEKLKGEIRRLDQAARRTAAWSDAVEQSKKGTRNSGLRPDRGYIGHKAAKMMKRSKAVQARRETAAEEKARLLSDVETAQTLKLHPLTHPQRRLVEVRDLAVEYGNGPVCRGVTFTVEQGERVALRGANGVGKSSLLKLLAGEKIAHTGQIKTASGLVVSYVPQDTSFLRGGLREFIAQSGVDESLFKTLLRKLDFSRAQFDLDMKDYSAGQKKKVLLARSLCTSAHLYLWDEPLNYVDLWSRMQLEELLASSGATLVFVEHDRAFSDRVATKTVELERSSHNL